MTVKQSSFLRSGNEEANVLQLKELYLALRERLKDVVLKMAITLAPGNASVPMSSRPLPQQEAFILLHADLKLLEELMRPVEDTLGSIVPDELTSEQIEEAGGLVKLLAMLSAELLEVIACDLGVANDSIIPAIITGLQRQIHLIDTLVQRAEADLKSAIG